MILNDADQKNLKDTARKSEKRIGKKKNMSMYLCVCICTYIKGKIKFSSKTRSETYGMHFW